MKRLLIIAALFGSVGHADQEQETLVDMTTARTIFVGWVDINPDDWLPLGYADKQQWSEAIDWHNQAFQRTCQANLAGRQITGAKNRSDENASGQELHVRFSEVRFDVESYRLFVSVHFIDPKSGLELASLPIQGYRGGHFSVSSCLRGALEKLARAVEAKVARPRKKTWAP